MNAELKHWVRHGDRGISSNAMVEVFEGYPQGLINGWSPFSTHPHDPSDFNRCYKLLEAVPGYREQLPKTKAVSNTWKVLVEHWSELEELLLEEEPSGKAPKMYKRMRKLIEYSYQREVKDGA